MEESPGTLIMQTKKISKNPGPFNVISRTSDIIIVEENEIYNNISTDRGTPALYNAPSKSETERNNDTENENHRRDEEGVDENNARVQGSS